jgi:hypothetical protein
MIVDVEHPSYGASQWRLVRACGTHGGAGRLKEVGPCLATVVDVLQLETGLVQELRETNFRPVLAKGAQLLDPARPPRRDRVAEASKHDFSRLLVEFHVTTRGKEGKLRLHRLFKLASRAAEQGSVTTIESELSAVGPYEVEDGAEGLSWRQTESASELLQEEDWTLRWTEHEHRVHRGDVDSFIEEVDREHHANAALRETPERGLPLVLRAVAPDCDRRNAMSREVACHEPGVLDADAESKAPHVLKLGVSSHLL